MLETIREFAVERLEASGEAEDAQRRHAAWFLALAEHAATELSGPDQAAWLNRLGSDRENLRAALAWLRRDGDHQGLLRLVWALFRFWRIRGHLREGRVWLEDAAEQGRINHIPTRLRAAALYGAGWLATDQGDLPAATAHGEASLAIARDLEDHLGTARALGLLGWVASRATDYARARAFMAEALTVNRAIGDEAGIAGSLSNLGLVAIQEGAFDQARALLAEAREIFERYGEQRGAAQASDGLSVAFYCQGDVERAEPLAQQALDVYRRLGDKLGMAIALDHVGKCARRRGDLARSWAIHQESLHLRREIGSPRGLAVWLEVVASLIAAWGCPEPAAHVLGAGKTLRLSADLPYFTDELIDHERVVARLRDILGPDRFRAVWAEGEAMPLDRAIAEAESVATETAACATAASAISTTPAPFDLTPREVEVLRLLTQRATDREIAAALFISPRTVARHVAGILAKLGVHSRREAATIAAEHGLE